jgi:hypothetical protein
VLPAGVQEASACAAFDAAGVCCEPPHTLDECGVCSSQLQVSATRCAMQVNLYITTTDSVTVDAVASYVESVIATATGISTASLDVTVGISVVEESVVPALQVDSAPQTLSADAQAVATVTVLPPDGGWPESGAGSRETVQQDLYTIAIGNLVAADGTTPSEQQQPVVVLSPTAASPTVVGLTVCSGACDATDQAAGCSSCVSDPAGFSSRQVDWNTAVCPAETTVSAAVSVAVYGDATSIHTALGVSFTTLVWVGAAVAIGQMVLDVLWTALGRAPMFSGPKVLPGVAALGLVEVLEQGQFAFMLSQLHVATPPILVTAGELAMSTTGMIPGAWGALGPMLQPMVPVPPPLGSNVSSTMTAPGTCAGVMEDWNHFPQERPLATPGCGAPPEAIRAFAYPLNMQPEALLALGIALFILVEIAVGVCHGACVGVACVMGRNSSRVGGRKSMKKTESSAHLTEATEVERPPAWKLVLGSWAKAAAQVALVFYAALSILSMYEIQRPQCGGDDTSRVGGWLWLAVYVFGGVVFALFSLFNVASWCCARKAEASLGNKLWPLLTLVDRIVSAMLLLFLADRPGTQAGAMLAKQLIYLMGMLLLRPVQGSVAHGVMTVVATGRAIILALMLAFIPPHDVASSADLELVGFVILGVQLLLAIILIGLVLMRFGSVALLVGRMCGEPPKPRESKEDKPELLANPLYHRKTKAKPREAKDTEDAKDVEPVTVRVPSPVSEEPAPEELKVEETALHPRSAAPASEAEQQQRVQFVPVRAHAATGNNSRAQANPLLRPKRPTKG